MDPASDYMDLFDVLQRKLYPDGDHRRIRQEFSLSKLDLIERRIASLASAVRSLRNAFSPVHKLPCETLAQIFSMLVEPPSHYSFMPNVDSMTDPYAWLNATHVCRHWRDVALAFPSLWTTIDGSHPHAALTSLSRSKQAPLYVYLHDKVRRARVRATLEDGGLMSALAPHSARFVELHLEPQFHYRSTLLEEFRYPAPQLRALSLGPNLGKADQSVLPTLFAGETPHLERLALSGFTSWPGNNFVDLTHLCIYCQVPNARPRMQDFVDMLATCPRLEELMVCSAGPDVVDATPDMVSLPALRRLSLGDWFSAEVVACFLSHLAIPEETEMTIWGDALLRRDQAISAAIPEDTSCLRPLHGLASVSVVVDAAEMRQLVSVHKGRLEVYGSFESGAALPTLFSSLDLHQVGKLTVGGMWRPEPSREEWRGVFANLPHLTTLEIKSRGTREMLKALYSDDISEATLLPCPELATLSISNDKNMSTICLFMAARGRASLGHYLQDITVLQLPAYCPSWQQLEDVISDIRPYVTSSARCVQVGAHKEVAPCWEAYNWTVGKVKGRPHRRT
ncbi:hypothetical protein B0H21DRAFT_820336 [Amylocystis lapponica]|nr:hypothetical protein B0H21DRAFT_820336 [Amylocystis lapponica]